MKNNLVGIVLAMVCIPLASCSASTDTTLEGVWTQTNSASETSFQQANISEGQIEIFWVNDSTSALYWAGSYDNSNGSFVSENDTERTDSAILASGEDTKEFTVKNGVISYSVGALGVSTVVQLEKTGALDVDTLDSTSSSSETNSEWRQFLVDYEAWVDRFIPCIESYKEDPSDMDVVTDYRAMVTETEDWMTRAGEIEGELSAEDLAEYIQSMERITDKLMKAIE